MIVLYNKPCLKKQQVSHLVFLHVSLHSQLEGKQAATDGLLQEKQNREKEVKDLKNQLDSNQKQVNVIIMKCLSEDG